VRLKDFRHGPVLGGHEEGAVRAHQKNRAKNQIRTVLAERSQPSVMIVRGSQPESEQGDQGDADLCDFPEYQRVALAVPVGQVAGDGAENCPGDIEQNRHQRNGVRRGHGLLIDGKEHGRGMDGLIVEGGQELGHEQTNESPGLQRMGGLKRRHA
jgi:hypothetical protein